MGEAINILHYPSSNWGDGMNYFLATLISNNNNDIKALPANMGYPGYLFVGSIIEWAKGNEIEICGSGFINRGELQFKPKKIHFVRGPLTRKRFLDKNIFCPEIYGDPALLFPKFYNPTIDKKYELGIIPHRYHYNSPLINQFKNVSGIKIINIDRQDIGSYGFINEVLECEAIVSTSLHGLIIADAYNIPTGWIHISNLIGGWFKFTDYLMSINEDDLKPLIITKTITKSDLLGKTKLKDIPINLDLLLKTIPFK